MKRMKELHLLNVNKALLLILLKLYHFLQNSACVSGILSLCKVIAKLKKL